jgi:hypothetical protein
VSRSSKRTPLVPGQGSMKCPVCGGWLSFTCDRAGCLVEHCECGHRQFVEVRSGVADPDTPRRRARSA